MKQIIKRRGHKEEFDERKVYASVYAACLNAHHPVSRAEELAAQTAATVREKITDQLEITSDELFKLTIATLKTFDPEAAFMYETHRDIS